MRRYRRWAAAGVAALLLLAVAPSTPASAAGRLPGRILYIQFAGATTDQGPLLSARPDGSSPTDLNQSMWLYERPDYSPDGTRIAYVQGWGFYTMAADGTDSRWLVDGPCGPSYPRWSPDGQWIIAESCGDIYRVSPQGYEYGWSDLTGAYSYNDLFPVWSPDSKRFATSNYPGVQIYKADGSATRTLTDLAGAYRLAWSPDGRTLAVEADGDIWLLNVRTGAATRVTNTPDIQEISPVWSPDGRWLAYGRGPGTTDPDFPGNTTDPTIWLMNRTGGNQHPTGIHGVPTSWRAQA